ncbi:MAG: hypothetical protein Q7S90_10820 [Rubrivivax sp.]|nr:hypothetical protein [Rubrivivax sp.]
MRLKLQRADFAPRHGPLCGVATGDTGAIVGRHVGEPDFPALHALVETLPAEAPAPA